MKNDVNEYTSNEKKIHSICLIIAWFGELPNYFKLWIKTVENNDTIDFLFITNNKFNFETPHNLKIKILSFKQFKSRIQNSFDFKISLDYPYKICDYKVAYGEIFAEELKNYDYWGFCDLDLLFGDIRSFFSESILNQYTKFLSRGHLTIFRNEEHISNLYRTDESERYKGIYTSPLTLAFSECTPNGINDIFLKNGEKIYDEIIFFDVAINKFRFYPSKYAVTTHKHIHSLFFWENGKLFRFYKKSNDEFKEEEFLYVHFQKRNMPILNKNQLINYGEINNIVALPNSFIFNINRNMLPKFYKSIRKKLIYFHYIKYRYKNMLKKLNRFF
jgi:hypothetical protein